MSQTPPTPPENPYGAQPAGAGQPYPPAQPKGGSGLAIGALVAGVLALIFCWTIVGGIVLGLVAVVLGFVASGRAKRGAATGRGLAITGIVVGGLGLLISVVIIVAGALFLNSDSAKDLQDCLRNATSQADQQQCQREFQDNFAN